MEVITLETLLGRGAAGIGGWFTLFLLFRKKIKPTTTTGIFKTAFVVVLIYFLYFPLAKLADNQAFLSRKAMILERKAMILERKAMILERKSNDFGTKKRKAMTLDSKSLAFWRVMIILWVFSHLKCCFLRKSLPFFRINAKVIAFWILP